MPASRIFRESLIAGSPATLLGYAEGNDGEPIEQDTIDTITVTVVDLDTDDEIVTDDEHVVADSVSDTLQTGFGWNQAGYEAGYNVALECPGSYWPTSQHEYEVTVTFTPVVGDAFTWVHIISALPAADDADSVTAYLTIRDAEGNAVEGETLTYQVVGSDDSVGDGVDMDIHEVESDAAGVAEFTAIRGTYVKYWLGHGKARIVHIDDDTADPYQLPTVLG